MNADVMGNKMGGSIGDAVNNAMVETPKLGVSTFKTLLSLLLVTPFNPRFKPPSSYPLIDNFWNR